jgi:dephospho-CoA kinase
MLRVGLTGGLGSGKSTVAAMLRSLGAEVVEADELGRALMEPGQPVFTEIVRVFGAEVVGPDGRLNRARLAEMAFKEGRLQELNAIVHPAVIAAEEHWMKEVIARNPDAVAVVESALIFEVERDARLRGESETVLTKAPRNRGPLEAILASRGGRDRSSSLLRLLANWRQHMDRIVVVTAPDELKIARFVARVCPSGTGRKKVESEARQRMAHQIPDAEKAAQADYVIENSGNIGELRAQVERLWLRLVAERNYSPTDASLE